MTIHESVHRVILDVMVNDADEKPVHGLKASDFSITEEKKPQKVLSFDEYDLDKPPSLPKLSARLPPNVFVNIPKEPERGPLYVILLDLVNTSTDNQMWSKQQILKFIGSKPAGTRFAVFVNSDALALVQGFTDDKDLLSAALDGTHHKAHVPAVFMYGGNHGRGDYTLMAQVLNFISTYLDGFPGRKVLMWAADQFPIDLYPREGDPVSAQDQIRAELNVLAQAQIAVFPIKTAPINADCEGCLTGARPFGGGTAGNPGMNAGPQTGSPFAGSIPRDSSAYRDYFTRKDVASMTGGRFVSNGNDLAGAFELATENAGNYYTLTYAPPDDKEDGKCHKVAIKIHKEKYHLYYRSTYCRMPLVTSEIDQGAPSTLAVPVQAGDVLQANMKLGAPMVHDLVFSAHVRTAGEAAMATPEQMAELQEQANYFLKHRKNRPPHPLPAERVQAYTIDYRVLDPQFKAEAARAGKAPTLEFAVAAFDADGHVLNGLINDGMPDTSAPTAANKGGLYLGRQSLVVPAGAVSIRVGVRDRLSDRLGTLEVPLPLAAEPVAQVTSH